MPEFGQCGGGDGEQRGGCCAPFRCYRQSRFYAQCGSACPLSASPPWDCANGLSHREERVVSEQRHADAPSERRIHGAPPSVGVLIGRWGRWPPWTPLLLRSLGANPTITFILLSDEPPRWTPLPANVVFHRCPLGELLERLRRTVGCRLRTLSAGGTFASGVSAAKVNDLKPMWGEAFAADLLRGFEWWGYLQEDVIVGDLRALIPPHKLASADVICPFNAPLNSSGIFMLFRNVRRINRAWRRSADAARALSDPRYIVFDEWWGSAKDPMAAVWGRSSAAGEVRSSMMPPIPSRCC